MHRDRSEALTGWRYWQLTPDRRLRSVALRRFVWPPGEPLRAACVAGRHRPPAPGCGCGLSATADLESLRARDQCLSADPLVVGEVALWGEVLTADDGYRAELAEPATLWLVADTVAPDERDDVRTALAAAYAGPVALAPLDWAVSEISATLMANEAMARRTATR
jgi:hypothetical protein